MKYKGVAFIYLDSKLIDSLNEEELSKLWESTQNKITQELLHLAEPLFPFEIIPTLPIKFDKDIISLTPVMRGVLIVKGHWLSFLHARRAGLLSNLGYSTRSSIRIALHERTLVQSSKGQS